jgi:type IV secretion system protein VirB6
MTVLQNCPAANYGAGLLPTILSNVDQTGCNYVQGAFQELARSLTQNGPGGLSVATLMLTAYVIFWGYGIWAGTATGTATDAVFRLFRAFVIYTIATSWSDFTALIYTAFNDGPSAIGNQLLTVGNNFQYSSPNAVVTALENIWNQISKGFQLHWTWSLESFAAALVGLACVVIVALFLAVCLFTIILSKVFLWLLLGLAPIVILLLLFSVTGRYFSGWLNGVAMYATLQLLAYAFLAFYLTVTKPIFDNLQTALNSGMVDWTALAPFFVVGLTGLFLAAQLPSLASTITGGIPLYAASVSGVWRSAVGYAAGALGGVSGGVYRARLPGRLGESGGWNLSWRDRNIRARHDRIYGRQAADILAKKMDQI